MLKKSFKLILLIGIFVFINCEKSTNKPDDEEVITEPKTIVAVYVGNSPEDVTKFEQWLGRPVDGVLGYTGAASWQDYDGSVGWAAGLWRNLNRPILWSVPLIPQGATLEQAARGAYNSHYLAAARNLKYFRMQDSVLYVRTGWEFDGNWFPWAAKGKETEFVAAWRNFVTCFRAESDRFRFDWCPNFGDTGMNPELAYPGDEYVDIIGMDIYDESIWCNITDPVRRWNFNLTELYGLNWHRDFANAHNKPMSYSEWGVGGNGSGDNPYYVEMMAKWCKENKVVYHTYWDSNADYPGKLSENQYPQAAAKYKDMFGQE